MQELPVIRKMAYWIFYGYKFAGVLTIPLITLLFMTGTANLNVAGRLNVFGVDIAWAIVYAICFEMNGLRIVIDATIEAYDKKLVASVIDYTLGVLLLSLGAVATFIESLVNAHGIEWSSVVGNIWIVLLVRTVVIVLVCIRECVHYAPLVMNKSEQKSLPQTQSVTNVTINQTNQTLNVTSDQTLAMESEQNETQVVDTEPLTKLLPERSQTGVDKIIELYQTGMRQVEIVNQTGLSKGHVSNTIKNYKQTQVL